MNQVLLSQFNEKDKINLSDLDGLASSKEETKIRSMQAFYASSFGTIVTKTTNAHEKAAASVAATANKNVSAAKSSTPVLTTSTDINWPPTPSDSDEANSGYSSDDIPSSAFDTIQRLRDWMDFISKSPDANISDIENFLKWTIKIQKIVDSDGFRDKYAEGKLATELKNLDVYSPSGGQIFKDEPANFSAMLTRIVELLYTSNRDKAPPPINTKPTTPDYNKALGDLENLKTWLDAQGSSNQFIKDFSANLSGTIGSFNQDIKAGGWIHDNFMNTIDGVLHMKSTYDIMYEDCSGALLNFFAQSKGKDTSPDYELYSQWSHNTLLDQIDITMEQVFGTKSKHHWPAQAVFLLLCILLSYVQKNQDDLAAHGGTSHILAKLTNQASALLSKYQIDWTTISKADLTEQSKDLIENIKFISDLKDAFAESSLGSISDEIKGGLDQLGSLSGPTDPTDTNYNKDLIDPNLPDDPKNPGKKVASTIENIMNQYLKDGDESHLAYIGKIMQYEYTKDDSSHQYPSGNQTGAAGIQQVAEAATNQSKVVQTEMSQVSQLINQVIGTFNSMLTEIINQEKVKVQNEKQSS
jgi:hypothetical protein